MKTINEFVLSSSIKVAERVIAKYETITLSDPDWGVFYNALLKPPKPNSKLQTAFKQYIKSKR